jgi:hypothetical protein
MSVVLLNVILLNAILLNTFLLIAILLKGILLNVILLSVIVLNVVAVKNNAQGGEHSRSEGECSVQLTSSHLASNVKMFFTHAKQQY